MESWRRKAETGARWTEREGREVLSEWRASGESLAGFARRNGLNPQRLSWWRDRLSGEQALPASLVPVTVRSSSRSGAVITVGEVRIEVTDAADVAPDWLAALAAALPGANA